MESSGIQPNPLNKDFPYWDLSSSNLSMSDLSDLDYRLNKSLALLNLGMAVHHRAINIPHEVKKQYPSDDKTMIHSPSFKEWEVLVEASLVFFISCWERERPRRSDEIVLLAADLRRSLPRWSEALDWLREVRIAKIHPRTRRSPTEITLDSMYGEAHLELGPVGEEMASIQGVMHISEQSTAGYARVIKALLEFSLYSVRAERHRQRESSERQQARPGNGTSV
ncbi:MAG: hypothetical protein OXG43_13090 [Chloroflexi bacterium]|nr:hypothetical protein [Chloroflexota bacterium]